MGISSGAEPSAPAAPASHNFIGSAFPDCILGDNSARRELNAGRKFISTETMTMILMVLFNVNTLPTDTL